MAVESAPETEPVGTTAADESTTFAVEPGTVADRRTRRWYGVTVFALLALGLGVLTRQPGLLLTSAFGIAFAGYGQLTSPPPVDLDIERTISDRSPESDAVVEVTVTVRNTSDRFLPDLRLLDGVPPKLTVEDGSPRHATALRSDGETTFTYSLRTRRGHHAFEPATVLLRDASGATERVGSVASPSSIDCEPSLPVTSVPFPLRAQTTRHTGRFPADAGGPGVEFYATREYQTGDPLSRVDWKRTARTGDLTTVQYRVEQSVSVLLVVDARTEAYTGPDPDAPTAVEAAIDAARHVYVSLTGEGHSVGITALSPEACWLEPGYGDDHRVQARELLATHPAFSPSAPEADTNIYSAVQRLTQRAPSDAQIVLFSPLADDLVASSAIRLDAHGHKTTVVSPDPTTHDTPGHRLASVRRANRLADLRKRGLPVIDWNGRHDFDRVVAGAQGGRK